MQRCSLILYWNRATEETVLYYKYVCNHIWSHCQNFNYCHTNPQDVKYVGAKQLNTRWSLQAPLWKNYFITPVKYIFYNLNCISHPFFSLLMSLLLPVTELSVSNLINWICSISMCPLPTIHLVQAAFHIPKINRI